MARITTIIGSAVPLGHLEVAHNAIDTVRSMQPDLTLDLVQDMFGVVRPEIDARRNALLRQAGLQ